MKPKIGEAVLVGNMKTKETPSIFGDTVTVIGGDRSFSHDVWVCLAVEEDRCILQKLCSKDDKPSTFNFGSTKPYMLEYDWFPILKCSEETFKAMTGYSFTDNLLEIIQKQTEQKTEIQ